MTTIEQRPDAWDDVIDAPSISTEELVELQRERFGGVKIGSAFFGWLIAVATFAILTGLVTVAGVVLGLDVRNPLVFARELPLDLATVGWIGRGRCWSSCSRPSTAAGTSPGAWPASAASRRASPSGVDGRHRDRGGGRRVRARPMRRGRRPGPAPAHPLPEGTLTIAGIVTAAVVALASLGGAILGGVVGVRRRWPADRAADDVQPKADRAGFRG